MNGDNPNGNLFMKQVSKIFENLSSKQPEPSRPSPRMTCTRLRRLREIRRELVLDSDSESDNESKSFADWVARNQQSHQPLLEKQNPSREEIKNKNKQDANKTVHGFANFSPSALQLVAQNPSTPESTLRWLAAHYRAEVRQSLATNENISGDILNILVRDSEDKVKEAVLDNKKITRDAILKLSDDQSPLIAEKAKNLFYKNSKLETSARPSMTVTANIDVRVLLTSTQSSTKSAKFGEEESIVIEREFLALIAKNSTTPPRRLAELAVHPDSTIRCLVAGNLNATEEICWQLAKDPLPEVRLKLIDNYNCPVEVIEYLQKAS